jgi:hypothetical protein
MIWEGVDCIHLVHDKDRWLVLSDYKLLKKDFVPWSDLVNTFIT